jgi:WG containing repeat
MDCPLLQSEKKCGYIDKTGKIVINPQFRKCMPFYQELALVGELSDPKAYGYIDKSGKYVWQSNK